MIPHKRFPTAIRLILSACIFSAAALVLPILSVPATRAASKNSQDLFERRCTGCHRLDEVRTGPRLRGVFGRAAGSDPGYPYSKALKLSHLTWNEATLDQWLTDPDALVPDNDMAFRVSKADERAEIIAYLKSLRP
jgi:cytochrome c